jgi:cellulose synthase/poly-beta-1,6-N-acetylglucosamine synthase-like glycosyltransferase
MKRKAALICTTYNCKNELEGPLRTFTSAENLGLVTEIVIVDGGSSDGTWELLEQWSAKVGKLKVHRVPGANIPRGRNEAFKRTDADIVVSFDSGTKYADDWLRHMIGAFDDEEVTVAGTLTHVYGETLYEQCFAALCNEDRAEDYVLFNPSHRGFAITKKIWEQIGGYPEHVPAGEDTWFNTQWRKLECKYAYVPQAKQYWRVRSTWKGTFKMQRRNTRGHIVLREPREMFLIIMKTVLNLFIVLCVILGFFASVFWLTGLVMYLLYLISRMFFRGRWRTFVNPVKVCVGIYAITASDWGTGLGAIEGVILLLTEKISGRRRRNRE